MILLRTHSLSKNWSAIALLLVVYEILTFIFVPSGIGLSNGTCRAEPMTGCFSFSLNYAAVSISSPAFQSRAHTGTELPSISTEETSRSPASNLCGTDIVRLSMLKTRVILTRPLSRRCLSPEGHAWRSLIVLCDRNPHSSQTLHAG